MPHHHRITIGLHVVQITRQRGWRCIKNTPTLLVNVRTEQNDLPTVGHVEGVASARRPPEARWREVTAPPIVQKTGYLARIIYYRDYSTVGEPVWVEFSALNRYDLRRLLSVNTTISS